MGCSSAATIELVAETYVFRSRKRDRRRRTAVEAPWLGAQAGGEDWMETHPYRQAVVDRNLDRLVALFADDVVFHSPVISDPAFEGRDSVAALYAMVFDSFEDVEFTHDLSEAGARIFVGKARVLGKPLTLTTLLELDPEGKIREIWVMIRPLSGVVAVADAIGSGLAKRRAHGVVLAVRPFLGVLAGLTAVTDRVGSRLIAALNRSTELS